MAIMIDLYRAADDATDYAKVSAEIPCKRCRDTTTVTLGYHGSDDARNRFLFYFGEDEVKVMIERGWVWLEERFWMCKACAEKEEAKPGKDDEPPLG